jgi:hypothetical protein
MGCSGVEATVDATALTKGYMYVDSCHLVAKLLIFFNISNLSLVVP